MFQILFCWSSIVKILTIGDLEFSNIALNAEFYEILQASFLYKLPYIQCALYKEPVVVL